MMESDQTTIFILMCVGVTAVGSIGRALPSLAGFRSLLAFHDAAYCICMQHLYAAAGCSEGKHYVTTLMDRLATYGIYGVCVCEIRSIIL